MKPVTTIGVCVRDCATTIHKAIESIIKQDYPHELMEVIFVDDGSKDATLSIIKTYVRRMKMNVKIFHHEWKGLGASRNIVVSKAKGKYIVWVDGDMILPPDHVRKQVEFMEKNPKVGIAKASYGILSRESIISFLENIPFLIHNSKLPGTGGAIYRVEAIRQVDGFDDKIKGAGEDQDAAFRIRKAGWLVSQSPAIFFEKRPQTWIEVWRKWFWYGLSNYEIYRINRDIFSLSRMNPIAGFLRGFFYISTAYKLARSNFVLLLPFSQAFEMLAWFLGFIYGMMKNSARQ